MRSVPTHPVGETQHAGRYRDQVLIALLIAALLLVACDDATSPTRERGREELTEGIGTGSERLLGDAELVTPEDPRAATVPDAWAEWIRANARPIRSLTSHRWDDLAFLKTVLGDRRLVQLGESGHGVREFNQAKVRLIQFLHEELGFDVIAFESGIHECWRADGRSATEPALSTMRDCIFGVWHTAEVLALFEYVRQTQATARPLHVAGFDIQYSSVSETRAADFLRDAIAGVDPAYAARVHDLEAGFNADWLRLLGAGSTQAFLDSMTAVATRNNLVAAYDSVEAFLRANHAAVAAAASPEIALVARQTAFSRARYVRQLIERNGMVRFEIRDIGMADNIDFLMDELYPGRKLMVWAHNAHIQHDRQAMRLLNSMSPLTRSMGTWVSERRRPELYTIGLFMYTGTAADNARRTYAITPPLPNSLEALFYRGRMRWLFADMRSAPRSSGTEWMYSAAIAKEWGVADYRMVLRDQYDGILFIHTVSPPAYR